MTNTATSTVAQATRSAAATAGAAKVEKRHLLTDEQVITFLIQGYLLIEPDCRPGLHEEVCRQFDKNGTVVVELDNDPYGDKIFDKAPGLREVFDHPIV